MGDASPLFISGLSIGGFGALRLGLKYALTCKVISAHSSITHLDQMALFVEVELAGYYQADTREHYVVSKLPATFPKLRFNCGTDNTLLEHNRALPRKKCRTFMRNLKADTNGPTSRNIWWTRCGFLIWCEVPILTPLLFWKLNKEIELFFQFLKRALN